jgi:hypothetical protein
VTFIRPLKNTTTDKNAVKKQRGGQALLDWVPAACENARQSAPQIIKFAIDGSKAELSFEGQHVLPRPDTNHQMDIQTASALLTANKKVGGIMQEILQNFSFRHGTLHVRSAQLIVRYQNLGIKSGFAKTVRQLTINGDATNELGDAYFPTIGVMFPRLLY